MNRWILILAITAKSYTLAFGLVTEANSLTDTNTRFPIIQRLEKLTGLNDSIRCISAINPYWTELVAQKRVPLIEGDSVIFLYRGTANRVSWHGDFNGWGRDKSMKTEGKRLKKTDIWYLKASFPIDARLDYKIVLNDKDSILDPINPLKQWGGYGPASILAMPNWSIENATLPRQGIKVGKLTRSLLINSSWLGCKINYRVYLPSGYAKFRKLPVIYVTDGQDYADERMGSMLTVLDNLIADKRIPPIIAVFIDQRDPEKPTNNRRVTQLGMNTLFLAFITKELIPKIDNSYRTNPLAEARGIIGASLGGLTAAYFGIQASDYFRLIGIQSPAFWYKKSIFRLYQNSPRLPLKIYMCTGRINDTQDEARQMEAILLSKGYNFQYKEVNEGHSWGNWRNLIDDILLYLFK